jgi:hypothetical protein
VQRDSLAPAFVDGLVNRSPLPPLAADEPFYITIVATVSAAAAAAAARVSHATATSSVSSSSSASSLSSSSPSFSSLPLSSAAVCDSVCDDDEKAKKDVGKRDNVDKRGENESDGDDGATVRYELRLRVRGGTTPRQVREVSSITLSSVNQLFALFVLSNPHFIYSSRCYQAFFAHLDVGDDTVRLLLTTQHLFLLQTLTFIYSTLFHSI